MVSLFLGALLVAVFGRLATPPCWVITPQDEQHSLVAIRDALRYRYNDDAFDRVICGEAFEGHPSADVVSEPGEYDGFHCHAALSIGLHSVLIFS